MRTPKKQTRNKPTKKGLHPRNLHKDGYDFTALINGYPKLSPYVKPNAHGTASIDFADPVAVKSLNSALLSCHYQLVEWTIPEGTLCPPIPGRADYIHYVAELLGIDEPSSNQLNTQRPITLLDIGTGANGIYPLLACQIYNWQCVGSDINSASLENVSAIAKRNPQLNKRITLRLQPDKNHIFEGIIKVGDFFDVSVCNPPFHASREDALKGSLRKITNLAAHRGELLPVEKTHTPTLNFGGTESELWCKGGEQLFLKKMIRESAAFSTQCRWFTSLVSKAENMAPSKKLIRKLGATDTRVIEMIQGNKTTRILAWTFL